MRGLKLVALLLIVVGALALAYGSFTYTEETHSTQLGPINLSVKDRKTVNIPVWAGAGFVIVGVVLLALRPRD